MWRTLLTPTECQANRDGPTPRTQRPQPQDLNPAAGSRTKAPGRLRNPTPTETTTLADSDRPTSPEWSRLSARSARCSTTLELTGHRPGHVVSRRSLALAPHTTERQH